MFCLPVSSTLLPIPTANTFAPNPAQAAEAAGTSKWSFAFPSVKTMQTCAKQNQRDLQSMLEISLRDHLHLQQTVSALQNKIIPQLFPPYTDHVPLTQIIFSLQRPTAQTAQTISALHRSSPIYLGCLLIFAHVDLIVSQGREHRFSGERVSILHIFYCLDGRFQGRSIGKTWKGRKSWWDRETGLTGAGSDLYGTDFQAEK